MRLELPKNFVGLGFGVWNLGFRGFRAALGVGFREIGRFFEP